MSRHPFRPAHRAPSPPRTWRHLLAGAVAVVAAGSVLGGANPAGADQVYAAPSSGTYTLTGAGFGHGNGMSQYGAKGAASRGKSAEQITDFYYPGTTYTTLSAKTNRVRLSAVEGRPVSVAAASGLVATDGAGTKRTLSASGATAWRLLYVASTKKFAIQKLAGGKYSTVYSVPGPVRVGGPSTITVQFGRAKGDCKRRTSATYSGTLRTLFVDGRQRSAADLPMEYYLRGVVPSESPASWPAAALQAQAVAARSYAAFKLTASRWYDSYDTTQDQCWDGAAAHHKNTDAAIRATAAKIRAYKGKAAFTQFSSSNGGYVNAGSQAYLKPKADPYEKYSGNPNSSWKATVAVSRFGSMAGLAKVTRVRVTDRDGRGQWGGRVLTLVVEGTNSAGKAASKTFTGQQVRMTLGLRSTYFTFAATAAAQAPAVSATGAKPTVWRKSTRTFYEKGGATVRQGSLTSRPLLVDRNGDGRPELGTYDQLHARWTIHTRGSSAMGARADIPVAGDVTGDKKTDLGVFRPSTGQWIMPGRPTVTFGRRGDVPLLRDYTGDGKADLMVYRPSTSSWYRSGVAAVVFGSPGDIPVPADYDGDGTVDIAVYTPSTGVWRVRGGATVDWGSRGDIPVPGDYDGDGKADMMVYRPSNSAWYAHGKASFRFGTAGRGDVPVAPLR
jgi:stage II sporulation protein D